MIENHDDAVVVSGSRPTIPDVIPWVLRHPPPALFEIDFESEIFRLLVIRANDFDITVVWGEHEYGQIFSLERA